MPVSIFLGGLAFTQVSEVNSLRELEVIFFARVVDVNADNF